jgi:hydroxypyruvate isomerase
MSKKAMTRRSFLKAAVAGVGGVGFAIGNRSLLVPAAAEAEKGKTGALRLSVCVDMIFREMPLLERLAMVAKCGLPAFEFWSWRDKDIDGILAKKKELGLEVAGFCIDPAHRLTLEKSKDRFVTAVRDTSPVLQKLGAKRMIVTTGNEIPRVPREAQHKSIVNCLKAGAPLAEEAGITLVLEPLNTLVDHGGYYLWSSAEGFEIVREVASKNVKLLYDIYHQQIMEGNLIANISKNIDLIGHFHVGDVPGRMEPGTGEINYLNVFKAIAKCGYDGFIGLEFRPSKSGEEALKHVKELAQEAEALAKEA